MGRNGNDLKLEGKRIGKLTVLRKSDEKIDGFIMWVCVCDCNPYNEILIRGHYLSKGKDNCGCETNLKQSKSKRKFNEYNLCGDYGIGYTTKGEEFYFDTEDYDKIKDYCWVMHDGYVDARDIINGGTIKMHRLIMNVVDSDVRVDHIYHKTNDNRKSQLRICNNQQNCLNHKIHKNNTSGKSGISFRKDTNKWRARIWYYGKCYSLGSFETYEEAVEVRNRKEIELFGEYRCESETTN